MNITLHIWRQANATEKGALKKYHLNDIDESMSLLEALDLLNEDLILQGEAPIVFDHDCREGICGQCAMTINGEAHGPLDNTSTCQIHMRSFRDGDEIYLEPFRSVAMPIRKDLSVDRSSLDRIIQAGGYISVNTGQAPEANNILVSKADYEQSMDAAACIGCGACIAVCPNGSAALFTAAKISHLHHLPQGQPESATRVKAMVRQMDQEGFGSCSNHAACEVTCPAGISISHIAVMNKLYLKYSFE